MWHSRVAACHDAMQLMHLVQKYRHRFCDEDGKPYGWVRCLREAADERREKILAAAAIGREVTDIMLLDHEYTELAFMQKKGHSYDKAHWLSNVRYPWQFEIEKEKLPHDKVREIIRDSLKSII